MTQPRRWRIRIFSPTGSVVEGGFASQEDAATRQTALNAVYAQHPEDPHLTVLEIYTPTRPVYEKVLALAERLRAELGEVDPILRIAHGLPLDDGRLALYDGLQDSLAMRANVVYDEEGRY
jgi:hypothetical protein